MCTIIGRKKEIAELNRYYHSGRPEFLAIYGRRRVGKTFLVDEVFRDNMTFHHTGLSPYKKKKRVTLKEQLQNFYFSLLRHGAEDIGMPKSWMEAFFQLEQLLTRMNNGSRQVVFIDELPWMDTPRSGFLTAMEAFWNGWGNTRHNLCLVVCGSATSWMLDNMIEDKGGLYGRVTGKLKLMPFTLKECEEFYLSRGIHMSRYNVVQAYMILGGIPYYMNYFNPEYSLSQNIDNLFFAHNPKLADEFEHLFRSVFDNADDCMRIVQTLGQRRYGYTREEISRITGINPNGDFTRMLRALQQSDFIIRYVPFGYGKKEEHYKLTDCFCWFWLHFMQKKQIKETDYWQHHQKESEIASWRGLSFEEVCMQHVEQIKQSLGVSGVASRESALIVKENETSEGAQMDLIIDRNDDVMNVCEIKFNKSECIVTSAYAAKLAKRHDLMQNRFPDKTVNMTLVCTQPWKNAGESFTSIIAMDDLFV